MKICILWEKGLLGDTIPQQLISIMVFYIGSLFVLTSGKEHRSHRYKPPQIELFEPPNHRPEDVLQNKSRWSC